MDPLEQIARALSEKLDSGEDTPGAPSRPDGARPAGAGLHDARIVQTVDGYEIVAVLERGRRRVVVEITDRRERIPRTLSLHRSRGHRRTTVGAPSFDRAVELSAPDPWALAVFDQKTRHLVQIMVERWGATVEAGRIKHSLGGGGPTPDREVKRTLRAAMDLARALSVEPERIPERLAENAVEDPEPHLRERALTLLVERHPERAPVPCSVCLDDTEPAVRLVAASALAHFAEWEAAVDSEAWPPESRAAVEGCLAELATNWNIEPEIRLKAFDRFVEVSDTPLVVLERALADPVLAERAVYATNRITDPGWLDLLFEIYPDCDETLQLAIAVALADAGYPRAELLLLDVAQAPGVAERLAEIGTARAIPVLKNVGTKEAKAAIERIKARVGDLSGNMALAEDRTVGAVSEADAGQVSMAEED